MSTNYSFWLLAFQQQWVDAVNLKGAVKTDTNPFGEITEEEYKSITNVEFTLQ